MNKNMNKLLKVETLSFLLLKGGRIRNENK